MSGTNLDYNAERLCPVYGKRIADDLCYDTVMAMTKAIKLSSVPELEEIKDIEKAKILCKKCAYSDLE